MVEKSMSALLAGVHALFLSICFIFKPLAYAARSSVSRSDTIVFSVSRLEEFVPVCCDISKYAEKKLCLYFTC